MVTMCFVISNLLICLFIDGACFLSSLQYACFLLSTPELQAYIQRESYFLVELEKKAKSSRPGNLERPPNCHSFMALCVCQLLEAGM
jgi:hypothetical protein